MSMAKFITAAQAAELFKDGDWVASSSFGLAGWAEEIALALEERFLKTGHPRDLTHIHAGGAGNFQGRGGGHWAHDGMTKRYIISHAGSEPQVMEHIASNTCLAYNYPLGVILQCYNDIARRGPGVFSQAGLRTFIDPRIDGGAFNQKTRDEWEKLIEVKELDGKEWLWYKPFPVNVAFLRATSSDENGNITCEKEGPNLELMSIAQAAKASDGIVIVQVERILKNGTMHPKQVKVPGIIVDYVVVAEKPQNQTMVTVYNPSFSGEVKVPMKSIPPMPMSSDKLICRRTAMEVRPGAISLGIGIPQGVASIIAEEKADSKVVLMSESGSIGGIPGVGGDFGSHWNAEASTEQPTHFNYYDGGGLDIAVFGLAETDPEGNCNASVFNGKVFGVGGFINVATNAKKTIMAGAFTAGGLKVKSGDGKLTIEQEGQFKKFLNQVAQISFSGPYAREIGQEVMFITERAVFELTHEGFVLTEIAPGIDLQKDVLDQMEFKPIVSPDLKLMDKGIFSEVWGEGELRQVIEG